MILHCFNRRYKVIFYEILHLIPQSQLSILSDDYSNIDDLFRCLITIVSGIAIIEFMYIAFCRENTSF